MKIDRNGIRFESNVDAVNYTIRELSFGVLYDTARLLRYKVVSKLKALQGLKKSKKARNAIQYWVRKKDCDLQIGYGNTKKNQTGDAWYAINQELGETSSLGQNKRTVKKQPRRMILRETVLDSLNDIQNISEQYFKMLNDNNPSLDHEGQDNAESGDDEQ